MELLLQDRRPLAEILIREQWLLKHSRSSSIRSLTISNNRLISKRISKCSFEVVLRSDPSKWPPSRVRILDDAWKDVRENIIDSSIKEGEACIVNSARVLRSILSRSGRLCLWDTEAIGNPFPRQSSAFDDRTLGKISDLMLRHRPTFYRERYGCALYVQREGRCILFSNVCSGSDDPQLPDRSFDRRSTDSRSHSIRKEWWTLYKIAINYRIDIMLSRLRFKIGIRRCRFSSANFLPRSVFTRKRF